MEEHEEKVARFKRYKLNSKVKSVFHNSIPSTDLQELPSIQKWTLGGLFHLSSVAIFISFLIFNYESAINDKFLSLQADAGKCSAVQKALSGNYLADVHGNWEGAADFVYSDALYEFDFTNLLEDEEGFYDLVYNELYTGGVLILGEYALYADLSINLVAWFSFTKRYVDGSVQNFHMNGDPIVVFSGNKMYGTIGDEGSDCNADSSARFDAATGHQSITFSYSQFMANENCSGTAIPEELGYNGAYDNDDFTVSVDVRSILTAVAVNTEILQLDELEHIVGTEGDFDYGAAVYGNNTIYNMTNYYDARYPNMDSVGCGYIDQHTRYGAFCGVTIGSLYAIPLFNHFGSSENEPDRCSCVETTIDGTVYDANGHDPACSVFNLMIGLLIFPNMTWEDSLAALLDIQYKYGVNSSLAAYDAMYAGSNAGLTDKYQATSFRDAAYEFCQTSYGGCSIITVNSRDDDDFTVSSYYYQLLNGSCTDTYTGTPAAWDKLASNPPTAIVENYYECSKTWLSAGVYAVGIAAGFVASMEPGLIILMIQLGVLYRVTFGKNDYANKYVDNCDEDDPADDEVLNNTECLKPTDTSEDVLAFRKYSKETRDNFMDAFALQLLMARDHRFPSSSVADPHTQSILYQLVREMKTNICEDQSNLITVAHYSGIDDCLHELRVRKKPVIVGEDVALSALHSKDDVELVSMASPAESGARNPQASIAAEPSRLSGVSVSDNGSLENKHLQRRVLQLEQQSSTLLRAMQRQQDDFVYLQRENGLLRANLNDLRQTVNNLSQKSSV